MLMTTDTDLLARALRGDREAFETVFEASFRSVFAFAARRTSGRAAAERLTARVLRRSFASLDDYAGDVPFAAWLLEIAKQVEREKPVRVQPQSLAHSAPR